MPFKQSSIPIPAESLQRDSSTATTNTSTQILDDTVDGRVGQKLVIGAEWLKEQTITQLEKQLSLLSKPAAPGSEDCCMSGCAVCVWDLYQDSFEEYKSQRSFLKAAKEELLLRSTSRAEFEEEEEEEDDDTAEEIDPSIKAFRDMERALKLAKDASNT